MSNLKGKAGLIRGQKTLHAVTPQRVEGLMLEDDREDHAAPRATRSCVRAPSSRAHGGTMQRCSHRARARVSPGGSLSTLSLFSYNTLSSDFSSDDLMLQASEVRAKNKTGGKSDPEPDTSRGASVRECVFVLPT